MSVTDRAHLAFALALHGALAPEANATVCWSPYSVASALGLVMRGATGTTRDELLALLGVADEPAHADELIAMLDRAAELDRARSGQDEPVIAVANTLWADESITVRRSFAAELKQAPNGSVRPAPMRAAPEEARSMINADVAETTNGLIPNLLPPGVIQRDTAAALVNALYLKVAWAHRFAEGATERRPFHAEGGAVEVPTMRLTESVGYAHAHGWRVVDLPAVGGVAATVLLPDGALAEAERALDADSLRTLFAEVRRTKVDLWFPKLRLRAKSELTSALSALGVRTLFTWDADLGGISEDPIAVHAVLHEAVLTVDEQGLEGAAATAVMMRVLAFDTSEPVPVRVDRPFLLLVRHVATGAIYFLARVTDPSATPAPSRR
jgi:serine protease inhibitor